MTTLKCPRVDDYEDDGEGGHPNACTGIIWRPDARGYSEPTPGTGGEFTFNVFEDSEGDAGVINGTHYFMTVELDEQTCTCPLTAKEMSALEYRAIEQAKERE